MDIVRQDLSPQEKRDADMKTKRKPPSLQKKKDEVNKKAIVWTAISFVLLIIVIVLVIVLAQAGNR
ncbi:MULTISPECIES: hypothetical protein [Paenibacillus]|jgi:uncharacterized membrane protein YvbJ|uniref:hypothetical protein n=1 Tax=Paenibacillus TaxID=44249 RepID=UPI001392423F|nr:MULTISPECIES: hypothetical protein [Paenibacillus]MDN4077221.1 hypothetical protein [Paenibacillus polymyxa]MDN4087180.1 hypothetical protein [Paenibacillus polymyxa]WOZ41009.1 hypothetical protein RQP19_08785 [Paenibacillus polymyxa]